MTKPMGDELLGAPSVTLRDLLEIENDPAILDFRCRDTGMLLWPLLRNQFLRTLSSDLYYPGVEVIAPPPAGRYRRALSALPSTLWENARRWNDMHGDIMIMASGAGHFQRDGKSFNRITDYFAFESMDNTVSIEGLMDWRVPKDRANPRAYYFLPWQGTIDLLGRVLLRSRHVAAAKELVEYARRRALLMLDQPISDSQAAYLTMLVSAKIARLPGMQGTYRRLLGRVRPKLVLLEQGCYSDLGVFNVVARDMNIRVAEPQHGLVSTGHDAYSYARVVRESREFRRYLPHDFLAYGDWWSTQINAPVNKWSIGHPHYTEQRLAVAAPREKRSILFLSDGFEFDKYLDLARDLKARIGDRYDVKMRPHPLERERIFARFDKQAVSGLSIDRGRDIYPSLSTAFAVVGELSTGLFEAIGLADRVFIWATPKAIFSCPDHPFLNFRDVSELAELVLAPAHAVPDVRADGIWAANWRENYRQFIEHALREPVPAEVAA